MLFLEQDKPDIHLGKTDIISHQSKDSDESNINHTEDFIMGSEQGTNFPTKIGTTMCNALIDTGANITRNYNWQKFICYKMSM